jgi:hypothetical protein
MLLNVHSSLAKYKVQFMQGDKEKFLQLKIKNYQVTFLSLHISKNNILQLKLIHYSYLIAKTLLKLCEYFLLYSGIEGLSQQMIETYCFCGEIGKYQGILFLNDNQVRYTRYVTVLLHDQQI